MTDLKRSGILFCLIGPTAGGKSTIGMRLLKGNPGTLILSISATSRKPRAGEVEGKSYQFLSREEFEQRISANDFFEWEEVHGNYYGTLNQTVEGSIGKGLDLLLDIDINGALNFRRKFPQHTVITFITPPSNGELVRRLKARSEVSESELTRRLETAKGEYRALKEIGFSSGEIDYFVVNDKLEESCLEVSAILRSERLRLERMNQERLVELCDIKG